MRCRLVDVPHSFDACAASCGRSRHQPFAARAVALGMGKEALTEGCTSAQPVLPPVLRAVPSTDRCSVATRLRAKFFKHCSSLTTLEFELGTEWMR